MTENEARDNQLEALQPVEVPKNAISTDRLEDPEPIEKRWTSDFKVWTADEMRALLSTPATKYAWSSRTYNWTSMQR